MGDSFDDALVEAIAVDDSDRVVKLCDTGQPISARALVAAAARGRLGIVEVLLANGAAVCGVAAHGLTALHAAAAAGSPLLDRVVQAPLDVDLAAMTEGPERGHVATIVTRLCDGGADVVARAGRAGMTPLHLARFFDQPAVAALLIARGADLEARDALGRLPDQLAVFPTIARAIRRCRRLAMVRAAYVTQLHAPATHQFTSPALALALAAPLPPDAFADWPSDRPLVVFALGEDALSRLVRLAPPVYVAPAPHLLTLAELVPGLWLRVRADIGELVAGSIVRYVGIDDLDNHVGRYVFAAEDGTERAVGGDLAASNGGPLAEIDHFLERA